MAMRPKPAPVSGIHLDGYVQMPGYLVYIAHHVQIKADGPLADTILGGKLAQGLLALNVIGDHLGFVPADSPVETTPAILAFITLDMASESILDHIRRPEEKAFLHLYNNNCCKYNKINGSSL